MTLNPQQFGMTTSWTEQGQPGNRTHITREDTGWLPIEHVAEMHGVMGEVPGEHRNKQGEQWEGFKGDIAKRGIEHPVFITVDPGEHPKMSEGSHRRDAAMALGHKHIPATVRYFGHAEREGVVGER